MAQEWAKSFYKSKEWQKCRAYILRRDGYKCQCHKLLGGEPCEEPANEVHHVERLTPANINDPSITLNPELLIAVEWNHHRAIENNNGDCEAGYEFGEDGQIVPVRMK